MAGRVPIGTYGELSDREYTEYQLVALQRPDRPDWHVSTSRNLEDQPIQLSVYQDSESGLLVSDVASFERWLRTVPTFRRDI